MIRLSDLGLSAIPLPGGTLFKANVQEAAFSLVAMGVRSVLALIGIAVGIGAVIAMVSIGEVVKAESLKQFRALGTDVLTIRRRYGGTPKLLTRAHVTRMRDSVPLVAAATPWTSDYAEVLFEGSIVTRGSVLGVTETFSSLHRLALTEGRFISDLDRGGPFCVLGNSVAANILATGTEELIGAAVRINGRLFTVVGVLDANAGSVQSAGTDESVLVPIGATVRMGQSIDRAIARLQPGANAFAAVDQVTSYFRRVVPDAELEVVSARELIEQMQHQAHMFTLLFGAVGSIALVVGGIGVMNVMIMSVAERRVEIGVRRALGARRRDIVAQFVTESVVLCLIGGFVGIVLGSASAWVICGFAEWSFFISKTAVFVGVGVSSAVGVFFGLYPARQAAHLDPITALRA